jgi:hypothetical protein
VASGTGYQGTGSHAQNPAADPRTITFTREDGSQVLVTLWPDGSSQMAERGGHGVPLRVWGPPIEGVWETPYMTTEETHRILGVRETG